MNIRQLIPKLIRGDEKESEIAGTPLEPTYHINCSKEKVINGLKSCRIGKSAGKALSRKIRENFRGQTTPVAICRYDMFQTTNQLMLMKVSVAGWRKTVAGKRKLFIIKH